MTTKAILSGYLPTDSGITDELADQLWPALGKEIVCVAVLKVDQHAEKADGDKPRTLTLKVVDLEVAADDPDQDALRKALRALYRDRTSEGTLDEVNPRDPADALTAGELLTNASTLAARGAPSADDGTDDDGQDWEYDGPEGTKGDTELQTAGAS